MSENDMQQELEMNLPPSRPGRLYVFPSAYGGAVQSTEPPQIHGLMKELRIEVGAVQAKKMAGGPMFPVRGAKDLNQKLADALNKLNMQAPVHKQDVTLIETNNIPDNKNGKGTAPVFRTLAHVKATVRLIAPDTSFIDVVGSGHGGDVDDKAGGKASTYAWKDALLKGLCIPHEDMVDTDDDSSTGGGQSSGDGEKGTKATGAGRGRKVAPAKGAGGAGSQGEMEPTAVVQSSASEEDGPVAGTEAKSGLAEALAKIEKANSVADLEQVREAIKSGAIPLHGADRLKATMAFTARKKELKE